MVVSTNFSGIRLLRKNTLPAVLLALGLVLAVLLREPLERLPATVDWDTIITLCGLLLITTGVKESGFFYLAAYRISRHIGSLRMLALFLVFVSALLSVFLTNDIALFIVVPLTLGLQQISNDDYSRIIIFEALAVNVGSALTPIGNPQNIFLWHRWGVSFPVFVAQMAPLAAVMAACLLAATLVCFAPAPIRVTDRQHPGVDRILFGLSAFLLAAFIVSIELGFEKYFIAVVFLCMLLARIRVVLKTDWGLLLLFVLLFIDLNLVFRLAPVQHLIALVDFSRPRVLFLSGAFMSQVISNVPSAIVLAKYSSAYKIIAYGVNVGGNGLVIGSFANLIALRFIKKPRKNLLFHVYSIPFFLVTLAIACFCLIP